MGQAVLEKAQVVKSGESQSIVLPPDIRFVGDEVYIRRDASGGAVTLFEKSPEHTWEEVFRLFDEAAAAGETLDVERDHSSLRDVEL